MNKPINTRNWVVETLSVFGVIFAVFLTLSMIPSRSLGVEDPDPCVPSGCNISSTVTNCVGFIVTLTNVVVSPSAICPGTTVSASVSQLTSNGIRTFTYSCTNSCGESCEDACPPPSVSSIPPENITNWWTVSGVGATPTSGSGLSASFTPSTAGSGKVTLYASWTDGCSTNSQTASVFKDFTVLSNITASNSCEFWDPWYSGQVGDGDKVTATIDVDISTCCADGSPIVLTIETTLAPRCINPEEPMNPTAGGVSGNHIEIVVGSFSSTVDQQGSMILADPNYGETYDQFASSHSRFACIRWAIRANCSAEVSVIQGAKPPQGSPRSCNNN